jgi:hypothetical protein
LIAQLPASHPGVNTNVSHVSKRWNTPRILQTALASIWVSSLLFFCLALSGVNLRQQALRTISQNIAPNVVAAQRIKANLSDMDATAADILLLPHNAQQEQCDDRYEARRTEVSESLASVVQEGHHSEAEYQAIRTLSAALGTYENDVAVARLLHLRGQLGSRLVFRVTHSEMHDTLLPSADAFGKVVRDELEDAYRRREANATIMRALVWIAGLLSIVSLIVTQGFLSHRMHRTLNPGLLGATGLTIVLLIYTQSLYSNDEKTLQTAKKSFASVMNLWQTRALAFDADAEESRWLMDTPQAPQYEQAYFAQSGLILTLPAGKPIGVNLSQEPLANDATGSLATTVRSANADSARAMAQAMLLAYGAFVETDGRLRALEQKGDHSGAVNFCIGRQPGQHDWAFTQFDAALDKMLTEDQSAFHSAVTHGLSRFAVYDVLAAIALLGILALSGIGLKARLQEYAF